MPQFVIQHILGFRVASRNRVSDHHQIRPIGEVLLGVTRNHFNSALSQKCGHRRINVLVGASDLHAHLLHRRRGRSHRRAANADEVNGLNA